MTKDQIGAAHRIRVFPIVRDAYVITFNEFWTFVRLAAAPIILTYVIGFIAGFVLAFLGRRSEINNPHSVISVLIWCIQWLILGPTFAVAWHRFVLLGPEKARTRFGFDLSQRELRFIAYATLLAFVLWGPHLSAKVGLAGNVLYGNQEYFNGLIALLLLWPAIMCFVVVKFLMVLPSNAIEQPIGLRESWKLTNGMMWRLLAIGWLSSLPFIIATRILSLWSQVSGTPLVQIGIEVFVLMVAYFNIAVAAAALSLSYRWIKAPQTS